MAGVVQQHGDLRAGEQILRRQLRRRPPEQRQGGQPPGDHRVQSHRPLDPPGGAVGRLLHVAPGLQDPVPVLDAPPQRVEVERLHRRPAVPDRKRRQQQPLHRLGAGRRLRLSDVDGRQAHRLRAEPAPLRLRNRHVQRLPAQLRPRPSGLPPGESLLAAGGSPRRGPVDPDLVLPVRRSLAHALEQAVAVGKGPVVLRPDQQLGSAPRPALGEQRRDVALAIHHRDHARARSRRRQLRGVAPAAQPAGRLALLVRLDFVRPAVRAVELDARNAQRHAVAVDRERAVHVDPKRAGRSLVPGDDPEAGAAAMGGEVQIGPVLDQQRRRRPPHALQRPLPVGRENRLRREVAVLGALDHPVVSGHRRRVAAGGREESLGGGLRLHRHAPHDPLDQRPAERGRAELVLRPAVHVEPLAGLQDRLRTRRRRSAVAGSENLAPVAAQRAHPDPLAIHPLAGGRAATAPGTLPNPDPARRRQAGAAESRPGEGLAQRRHNPVAVAEVRRKPAQAQAQRLRGEVPAADLRADQEPRHPDHPVETLKPGLRSPADPAVAGSESRGRAREHEAAQPAMVGGDQVAKLAAAVLHRPLRMLVMQQPRKNPRLLAPGDRPNVKAGNGARALRNAAGGGHWIRRHLGARRDGRAPPRRRQLHEARRVQIAQSRPAA